MFSQSQNTRKTFKKLLFPDLNFGDYDKETDWANWEDYRKSAFKFLDNRERAYSKNMNKIGMTAEGESVSERKGTKGPIKTPKSNTKTFNNLTPKLLSPTARQSQSGYQILPSRISTQHLDGHRPSTIVSNCKSSVTLNNRSTPHENPSYSKRVLETRPYVATGRNPAANITRSMRGMTLTPRNVEPEIRGSASCLSFKPPDDLRPRSFSGLIIDDRAKPPRRSKSSGSREWRPDGRVLPKTQVWNDELPVYSGRGDSGETCSEIFPDRLAFSSRSSYRKSTPKTKPRPYVASPEKGLSNALKKLQSDDWETLLEGFDEILAIGRENPDNLKGDLWKIHLAALTHVSNLRSKVSRGACSFYRDLFPIMRRAMEIDMDKIVIKLLERFIDANQFIRDDAFSALKSMLENVSPTRMIHTLDTIGTKHKNTNVRTATARITDLIVREIGPERILGDMADRILPMVASFLQQGSLDTRMYAKDILAQIVFQPHFESLLRRHVSQEVIQSIGKSIAAVKQDVATRSAMT